LSSKVVDAKALLDSSGNNVADPNTRQALSDAIGKASAIDSARPDDYATAASDVQTAMDAVTASVEKKQQDDAAAAQQAEAEKKAAEEAAAQKVAADKAAADAAAQQASQQAQQQAQQQNSGSAYYPNCAAVRAAGKAPLHRGDPGYSSKLDRDGDGIACE
jgi:glucan-binding YG repeat protein